MMGFVQMACGFAGGLTASLLGSPLTAFGTVIPAMELMAILSYLVYRRMMRRTNNGA